MAVVAYLLVCRGQLDGLAPARSSAMALSHTPKVGSIASRIRCIREARCGVLRCGRCG